MRTTDRTALAPAALATVRLAVAQGTGRSSGGNPMARNGTFATAG